MSTYLANLILVLAAAGKMLFLLSPAIIGWLVALGLIKSVGPQRRQAPGAQKGRNL